MNRKQRRSQQFAAQKPTLDSATADSFENLSARLGVGGAADNMISKSDYALNPLTRQRVRLEQMYRGSWIISVAVDSVADDMTKAGIDFATDVEPDDAETIQNTFVNLNIWDCLADVIRWSRLFGGAVAVVMIDGQELNTPLKIETVGKGQFKGLYVMDRWQLQPAYHNPVQDYGPDFGKPETYRVVAEQGALAGVRSPLYGKDIHHTRMFRFDGSPLPFYQRMAEFGWGMSIVERIYDRIVAFDSATQGAAQLVYKAHLRTLKVEGLTKILGMGGGPAFEALIANIDAIRKLQSTEGLTIIDAKDDMEYNAYGFAGLSEIIMQFGQQIAGAIQVPLVRLFGQSPAGLNSTGESDLRIYYDGINKEQEKALRVPITKLIEIIYRSELAKDLPEGFSFSFSPLWQKTDMEKAQYAKEVTDAVISAQTNQIISHVSALKELRRSSSISGIYTSITDEEIEEAENAPPDLSEMELAPENIEQLRQHPQMQEVFQQQNEQEQMRQMLKKAGGAQEGGLTAKQK